LQSITLENHLFLNSYFPNSNTNWVFEPNAYFTDRTACFSYKKQSRRVCNCE